MEELTKENISNVPLELGIYRIWAINKNKRPFSVDRFCGTDKRGLLYIGKTEKQTLRKRLYQFASSANLVMKTHNHSGGMKYFNMEVIQKKLSKYSLWFDYEKTNQPKEREAELLKIYSKTFGEYPPLNK